MSNEFQHLPAEKFQVTSANQGMAFCSAATAGDGLSGGVCGAGAVARDPSSSSAAVAVLYVMLMRVLSQRRRGDRNPEPRVTTMYANRSGLGSKPRDEVDDAARA